LFPMEFVATCFGGFCDAGPSRLKAAGRKKIPQLIIPGKVDIITFSTGLGVPRQFKHRKIWMHNPDLGLIRLNKQEMSLMGETMAEKLNKAV